jgi:Protein of unknown function (DUF1488)
MPLERASGFYSVGLGALAFPMRDAKTQARVGCKVSYEYLQLFCHGQPTSDALEAAFIDQREEIEAIASDKYDAGDVAPYVQEADTR